MPAQKITRSKLPGALKDHAINTYDKLGKIKVNFRKDATSVILTPCFTS
jgi:hypothetical protein